MKTYNIHLKLCFINLIIVILKSTSYCAISFIISSSYYFLSLVLFLAACFNFSFSLVFVSS